MNSLMTISQIKDRYDAEWVLIEDPETTEMLEVTAGKVLWHSKDRDELYRKAQELKPKRSAVLYMGAPPEDMVFML